MRIWLKDIRISQKKTQEEIASEIGKTRQYYSAIESGERGNPLPVPTAQKIAAALGFSWQRFYEA
ncbi:MAG: helix-turn-helix transcriptional regulator [Eubacteriales bacterium]